MSEDAGTPDATPTNLNWAGTFKALTTSTLKALEKDDREAGEQEQFLFATNDAIYTMQRKMRFLMSALGVMSLLVVGLIVILLVVMGPKLNSHESRLDNHDTKFVSWWAAIDTIVDGNDADGNPIKGRVTKLEERVSRTVDRTLDLELTTSGEGDTSHASRLTVLERKHDADGDGFDDEDDWCPESPVDGGIDLNGDGCPDNTTDLSEPPHQPTVWKQFVDEPGTVVINEDGTYSVTYKMERQFDSTIINWWMRCSTPNPTVPSLSKCHAIVEPPATP